MSLFINFEGSFCSKYSLALHVAYHMEMYGLLAKQEDLATRAHVSAALLAQYDETLKQLRDRNKEAGTSIEKVQTDRRETERDRLLAVLFFLLTSALRALNDEERAAAERLEIELRSFRQVRKEADDVETASIRSLLKVCNREDLRADVDRLKLRDVLDKLGEENERFAKFKRQRIQDRHARHMQLTTRELRQKADRQLAEIQQLIQATGVIASVTDKQEDVAYVTELMHDMNAVIRGYRTTWRQSEAQKGTKKPRKMKNEESYNLDSLSIHSFPSS